MLVRNLLPLLAVAAVVAQASGDVCALTKEHLYERDAAQQTQFPSGFKPSTNVAACSCRAPQTQVSNGKSIFFGECLASTACADGASLASHVLCRGNGNVSNAGNSSAYSPGKVEPEPIAKLEKVDPNVVRSSRGSEDKKVKSPIVWVVVGGVVVVVVALMLFAVTRNLKKKHQATDSYGDTDTSKAKRRPLRGTMPNMALVRLDSGFTAFTGGTRGPKVPPGPTTPPKRRKSELNTPPPMRQPSPVTPPKPRKLPERLTPPELRISGFSDVSLDSDTFRRKPSTPPRVPKPRSTRSTLSDNVEENRSPSTHREMEF